MKAAWLLLFLPWSVLAADEQDPPRHRAVPVLARGFSGIALGAAEGSSALFDLQAELVQRRDPRWSFGLEVLHHENANVTGSTGRGTLSTWGLFANGEYAPMGRGLFAPFLQLGIGFRVNSFQPAGVNGVATEAPFAVRAGAGIDLAVYGWASLSAMIAYAPTSSTLEAVASTASATPAFTLQAKPAPVLAAIGLSVLIP